MCVNKFCPCIVPKLINMNNKISHKVNTNNSNEYYIGLRMCGIYPIEMSLYRRKPTFPGSLTDLHRFRKTAHGHDGSSRIVMVRKTDQRTFASIENGQVRHFNFFKCNFYFFMSIIYFMSKILNTQDVLKI